MGIRFESYFEAIESDKRIEVDEVANGDFSVDVYLKNTMSPLDRSFGSLEKLFNIKNIKGEPEGNGKRYKLSLPKIAVPSQAYGLEKVLRYVKEEKEKSLVLGINDFGVSKIDLESFSHAFIFGTTGYGKSSIFRFLMTQTLAFHSDIENYIVDPKQIDFELFEQHPRVCGRCTNYTEWMNLFYLLAIELEVRKSIFSKAFEKSPNNLKEYQELCRKYKREDLPKFKKKFVWIDEAHLVFGDRSHMELQSVPVVSHLVRLGRAFGIHLIFSSQRWSDLTGTIRSQIPTYLYFFEPMTSGNGFHEHYRGYPVKAIKGRLGCTHGDLKLKNIQSPFVSDMESIAASYLLSNLKTNKKRETFTGFYPIKVQDSLLKNIKFYQGLLKGESFTNILREVFDEDSLRLREIQFDPAVILGIHGKGGKELESEKSEAVDLSKKIGKSFQRDLKPFSNIKQSQNRKTIDEICSNYKGSYKNITQKQLDWCLNEVMDNNILQIINKTLEGVGEFDSQNESLHINEVAISQRNRRLVDRYIQEIKQILPTDESSPLLILMGPKGVGKKSLIHAISNELELSVKKNDADGYVINKRVNQEDELLIFEDVESAVKFTVDPKPNTHPILLVEFDERSTLADLFSVNNPIKEKIKYLNLYHVLIEFSYHDFKDKEVLDHLVDSLLKKYDFQENLGNIGKLIANHQIDLIPSKIDSLFGRAYSRAKYQNKTFDLRVLKEVLEDFSEATKLEVGQNQPVEIIKPELRLRDLIISDSNMSHFEKLISYTKGANELNYKFLQKASKQKGTVILMSGPPGTGKTMSAEVLASELGRDLWICSISEMQSKYVGESERKIESLFRTAQAANCVLLLDECDAFLRSRDFLTHNHDSKIVNLLLMLINDFSGVLVMTTNFASSLDSAFSRRINSKLVLDLPTLNERVKILRSILEPDAPLEENINFENIVKDLNLSGGLIKNGVERAFMTMIGRGEKFMSEKLLRDSMNEVLKENSIIEETSNRISLC